MCYLSTNSRIFFWLTICILYTGSVFSADYLDAARSKCTELGFKPKTEQHGKCVLQLYKSDEGKSGNDVVNAQSSNFSGSTAPATRKHDVQESNAGSIFKECSDCPEMVAIPSGRFLMGANQGEEESEGLQVYYRNRSQPLHEVGVASFSIGRFEVTRGQYRKFIEETRVNTDGCFVYGEKDYEFHQSKNWQNPGFLQDELHPVVCVSWDDAKAYTAWLSQKTGKKYRLPTESEWEYAARARTVTKRFWGDEGNQACAYANGADLTTKEIVPSFNTSPVANCRDRFAYTGHVGSYRSNAFGLYDMLGNVYELTEDCWHENYNGAPTDGSAWTTGDCSRRVGRGGAWSNIASNIRSAVRNWSGVTQRAYMIGFRVARDN